jgi:hypothetical protein
MYCDKLFAVYERGQFPSAKKFVVKMSGAIKFIVGEAPTLRILKYMD